MFICVLILSLLGILITSSLPRDFSFKITNYLLDGKGVGFPNFTTTETGGIARIGEPVTVDVPDLPQGAAFHDSIRLHDGDAEIPSQTWNKVTHASDNFEASIPLSLPSGWN